eukprot:TRINITY_DN67558_c2_g1_i1.p1 TRINITY_DN67558_c2_g1~~TRINITY_DN67558_c2_g1_i1.p1  ORF type:complete len:401 (-),score=36.61 TRINITY_DN67558_c2_g1_i1:778-1815(-)
MAEGFKKMSDGFDQIKERFDRIDERFDASETNAWATETYQQLVDCLFAEGGAHSSNVKLIDEGFRLSTLHCHFPLHHASDGTNWSRSSKEPACKVSGEEDVDMLATREMIVQCKNCDKWIISSPMAAGIVPLRPKGHDALLLPGYAADVKVVPTPLETLLPWNTFEPAVVVAPKHNFNCVNGAVGSVSGVDVEHSAGKVAFHMFGALGTSGALIQSRSGRCMAMQTHLVGGFATKGICLAWLARQHQQHNLQYLYPPATITKELRAVTKAVRSEEAPKHRTRDSFTDARKALTKTATVVDCVTPASPPGLHSRWKYFHARSALAVNRVPETFPVPNAEVDEVFYC